MIYRSAMVCGAAPVSWPRPGPVAFAAGPPLQPVTRRTRPARPRRGGRASRRRQRLTRARPVIVLAALAFIAGVIVGAGSGSDGHRQQALGFISDWSRQRYAAMYADVDAGTRQSLSPAAFSAAYSSAWATATATGLRVDGHVYETSNGAIVAPLAVRTRLFGVLRGDATIPFVHDATGTHIAWSTALTFPGLRAGEVLHSDLSLPPRAALLARDGSVLASGPASPDGGPR